MCAVFLTFYEYNVGLVRAATRNGQAGQLPPPEIFEKNNPFHESDFVIVNVTSQSRNP